MTAKYHLALAALSFLLLTACDSGGPPPSMVLNTDQTDQWDPNSIDHEIVPVVGDLGDIGWDDPPAPPPEVAEIKGGSDTPPEVATDGPMTDQEFANGLFWGSGAYKYFGTIYLDSEDEAFYFAAVQTWLNATITAAQLNAAYGLNIEVPTLLDMLYASDDDGEGDDDEDDDGPRLVSLYGDGFYYIPGTDIQLKLGGYLRGAGSSTSLYGDGFYTIPGTDTALKLGGYMRGDAGLSTSLYGNGFYTIPGTDTALRLGGYQRSIDYGGYDRPLIYTDPRGSLIDRPQTDTVPQTGERKLDDTPKSAVKTDGPTKPATSESKTGARELPKSESKTEPKPEPKSDSKRAAIPRDEPSKADRAPKGEKATPKSAKRTPKEEKKSNDSGLKIEFSVSGSSSSSSRTTTTEKNGRRTTTTTTERSSSGGGGGFGGGGFGGGGGGFGPSSGGFGIGR